MDTPSLSSRPNAILKTFKTLNLNDLQSCAYKTAALNIQTQEDLKYFAELIVSAIRSSKSLVPSYAKLLFVLGDLSIVIEFRSMTLKAQISESCLVNLINLLKSKIDDSHAEELYSLVEFIAELYNLQIIDASCVELCMKELFTRETSCFFCVHCIDILMRKIGSRKSQSDNKLLDKYFNFFEHAVETNTVPFRTMTYKSLIELRNSGWLAPKPVSNFFQFQASMAKSATVSELLQDLETSDLKTGQFGNEKSYQEEAKAFDRLNSGYGTYDESVKQQEPIKLVVKKERIKPQTKQLEKPEEPIKPFQQPVIEDKEPIQAFKDLENAVFIYLSDLELAADKLKKLLSSSSRIEKFIAALTKHISLDNQKTSSYAKLCKKLAEITDEFGLTFKEVLNENIFRMFATFVCKQNLDDSAMKTFENVLIMVAELYKNDAFSNEDLSIWLQNKHAKKISLVCLTEVSAIISMKIISNGDKAMIRLLNDWEEIIEDETEKSFSTLKVEIKQLAILMNRIMMKN